MNTSATTWAVLAVFFAAAGLMAPRGLTFERLPHSNQGDVGVARRDPRLVAAGLILLGITLLVGAGTRAVVIGLAVVAATLALRRLAAGRQRRRRRRRHEDAVVQVCDALAAELRAGLPTVEAVERAFAGWPEWVEVMTAARLGADVPAAMRRLAGEPGADGLRAIAAAWEVAERSGAAMADVLDQIATGLRSDNEARAELTAALAPPRATAKLLAGLPVFGLGLGVSMGGDPLAFLLGTTAGLVCLATGIVLALVGVWWVERMADAVDT